jgi:uncharacterized membrane-anchored protein
VGAITAIIQTAMVVMGAIVLLVGSFVAFYFYYTMSGQEEGE